MKKIIKIAIIFFIIMLFYAGWPLLLGPFVDFARDKTAKKSSVPIEVVFVTAEKDFETLPYSVASLRKHIKNPVSKIVLVSKKTDKALKLASSLGMQHVDENSLLRLESFKKYVSDKVLHHDRPTWYYQQFLKLLYGKVTTSPYFLIVDADVVFMKPVMMISDYKIPTFFIGFDAGRVQYQNSARHLLGKDQFVPEFSFICNFMLFETSVVKSLINHIESKFKMPFYKAAINAEQAKNANARFSEYELYGIYANFNKSSHKSPKLASYLLKSHLQHDRIRMLYDQYDYRLKFFPYITYDHYMKGNKSSYEKTKRLIKWVGALLRWPIKSIKEWSPNSENTVK